MAIQPDAVAEASSPLAPQASPQSQHKTVPEDIGKWRRDPFIGTGAIKNNVPKAALPAEKKQLTEPPGSTEINLQGIMRADKAFHALINGRVVKTGDKLDGVTIKEISLFLVVVQNDKKEKVTYDIYQGRIDRGKK